MREKFKSECPHESNKIGKQRQKNKNSKSLKLTFSLFFPPLTILTSVPLTLITMMPMLSVIILRDPIIAHAALDTLEIEHDAPVYI